MEIETSNHAESTGAIQEKQAYTVTVSKKNGTGTSAPISGNF